MDFGLWAWGFWGSGIMGPIGISVPSVRHQDRTHTSVSRFGKHKAYRVEPGDEGSGVYRGLGLIVALRIQGFAG